MTISQHAPATIAIIEDERDLAEIVAFGLRRAGHQASIFHDGRAGLAHIVSNPPDLVIIDIMLPGMSGLDVARSLRTDPRTGSIPILMLTAKAEEADQIAGLGTGADDYMTKPFSTKVLMARVEALLRRAALGAGAAGGVDRGTLRLGPIVADLAAHQITVDGLEARMTLTEFRLLVALLQAPGRVVSRQDLISRVMGPGIVITTRTVDVHVAAIRRKLGVAGGMIRTVRGVGYQLTDSPVAHAAE